MAAFLSLNLLTKLFDWFPVGALTCLGVLGVGRAVLLHRRGVNVIALDRQRTWVQAGLDSTAAICLVLWAHEIIATAWPSARFFVWPAFLSVVSFDHFCAKWLGIVVMAAGVTLYGVALSHLGVSWRLGIDRKAAGPLITKGVYARSRHPIYVALGLVFSGVFLVQGRAVFLLLAVIMVAVLHLVMIREERFLRESYGDAYEQYCRRVGRYWSFGVRK